VKRAAARYSPRPLTEGERWTADALAALRRRRYRPGAWRGFIRDSLARSRESRAQRPALARQAARWGAAGGTAWAGTVLALRRHGAPAPNLAGGLAWWLAVWRMLDWHLGMAEGGDGAHRARLSSADAMTLARFWLVPALPAAARAGTALPAIVAIGGATDWLDGALARRGGRTRLGRDLDTTADLAFFSVAALAARRAGRLGPIGAGAIGLRHTAGLTLSLAAVFGRARRPAVRARPWGGALRVVGLVLSVAGPERAGTAILVAGCLVPPRSTAPGLSPA
jgi:phosphatidylglycerophosphate synthase